MMSISVKQGSRKIATAQSAANGLDGTVVLQDVAWVGGQSQFTNYVAADVSLESVDWSGAFVVTSINGSGSPVKLKPR